jgi:hypothetical protein
LDQGRLALERVFENHEAVSEAVLVLVDADALSPAEVSGFLDLFGHEDDLLA